MQLILRIILIKSLFWFSIGALYQSVKFIKIALNWAFCGAYAHTVPVGKSRQHHTVKKKQNLHASRVMSFQVYLRLRRTTSELKGLCALFWGPCPHTAPRCAVFFFFFAQMKGFNFVSTQQSAVRQHRSLAVSLPFLWANILHIRTHTTPSSE